MRTIRTGILLVSALVIVPLFAAADSVDITRMADGNAVGTLTFQVFGAGQNAFAINFLDLSPFYLPDTCDTACSLDVTFASAPSSGFATVFYSDGSAATINFPASTFDVFGGHPIDDLNGALVVFSNTLDFTGASFTGSNGAGDSFASTAFSNTGNLVPDGAPTVPEPTSVTLFGSTLIGIIALSWRRRGTHAAR